ncbi:transcription factor TFIIIB component B'' homolog [Hemiscyllium ocellatum]|uniref:transcription factor TFIIIB component B'' homolog n=1 Tax=Hemiscyllium ocellatum TaxID=170820 RepID=UPI002966DF15|nr:transcription factor TFIIIB component B'' homolog [Hemiscyllium ocellatum]
MFRRSRLSIKPNVKPGGRGSSQTSKEDDKDHTSVQQPSPERNASNENDATESQVVVSVPPMPPPNASREQEERDDPDEQQENVPINKNDTNDKTGESGVNSKLSVAPLQRRKRFSTMPNLAKPRSTSTSASTQPSSSITSKSLAQQQTSLTIGANTASVQGKASPSQTSATDKVLPKSLDKRKPASGQLNKLPEKKTPIPQVPQFSPVKSPVHKDPAIGTNTIRSPMTRKTLSSPLKERIMPSSPPAKGIVPSPNHSPVRPKSAKIPSDLERLRKARKLREMLKEELRKEKKARRETIPVWETGNPPERTKMTMRDFIYYLPDTNPMLSSFEEEKRPSFPVLTKEPEVGTINPPANEDEGEESDDAVLGPRVKVAEDGSIIIDEESLTVEVLRKKGPIVEENDPIFERGSQTTYSSFRKSTHTKPWSNKETDMFFLAISMVGTDFSMIGQLFPNRTRIEIKNKFKREEKLNSWRIDKAFKEKKPLDLDFFGELLTRVLEAESKRKKEKDEKTKTQAPRKQSRSKRNRKGKNVTEPESDPDDPDPVEVADTELAEVDSNSVVDGTEASCSVEGQEDAQKKESTSKPHPTKRKRKRKKKITAEPAEQETTKEPPHEGSSSQESKQEVQECKIGTQKSSDLLSAEEDNVGDQVAEGEDECHIVNGEISLEQGISENKQPSETKKKVNHNVESHSVSDHESEAPSKTTPPVTTKTSKKSQCVRVQKLKPNLKANRSKRVGGKDDDKTASQAIRFNDGDDKREEVQESSVQHEDAPNCDPPEIMNNEVSEKEINSVTADKTKKILESKAQGSDTESWPVEKQEESRAKPNSAARRRFQKPKPNLGKAVVLIDEKKIAPEQDKVITTEEDLDFNPNIPVTEVCEVSERTGSDPYFASDVQTVDTLIANKKQVQQDAVQGSSGASESMVPVSQSKVQSLEAATNSMEIETQSIMALDSEMLRRGCQDSNKTQRSGMPSECDGQEEHEDLKLDSIQDNIISKPTRSGRQPRPTAFYKSSAEHKPSAASPLLPEAESEDKSRSRRARSQKTKPKVSKSLSKKETVTKNAGKGQGISKAKLVTLRASQEDDDDDEPEPVEEDDVYLINPEEVNKVPAFVPISLRSPEPVHAEVEETMEELEIAVNVSDKNYDSETEQALHESPDKSEPSQSCSLAAEEDYNPATSDQIELFVEVIEIANEDTSQEEEYPDTEPGDDLQDAVCANVSYVDQKNLEQETILGSDPPPMPIVEHDTAPDVTDVCTESSRLGEQHIPTEKNVKDGFDLEELALPKEDSHNATVSSSSITEQMSSQTNQVIKRCRFLKPKPNLSKTTSRSHAKKMCPITESRSVQNSIEPSETTLQRSNYDNETKENHGDSLQLHLATAEADKQHLTTEQVSVEQPSDKVSFPDEQEKCVGNQEQMNKTEHQGYRTKHPCEKVSILGEQDVRHGKKSSRTDHLNDDTQYVVERLSIPEQQDQYTEDEEQPSRTEHLNDETPHVVEQLTLPEQQDQYVEDEEPLSRNQHVVEQLSIPEQQDQYMKDEEQLGRTRYLNDEIQHVVEQLSIPEQQNQCVEDEEQLSRTQYLNDETQHVVEQLSIPEQQDQYVEDEEQLSRTEHLNDETPHVVKQLTLPKQQDQYMDDEEPLNRTQHVVEQLSIPEQQDQYLEDEEQLNRTQHVVEQLSIPEQQDQYMKDEEQLGRTRYLNDEIQHVVEQLSIPEQQNQCVEDEEQPSRTQYLNDETQHVVEQLSIPEQQDQYVEDEEQLSRTEHLNDETPHVVEQLTLPEQQDQCVEDEEPLSRNQHVVEQLSIPEQQDQYVEDEEQPSRTQHLNDEIQHVVEQLSIFEQQKQSVENEEQQLSRTVNLGDETQHMGEQLSASEQQNQCVEDEKEQLIRTAYLSGETQHVVEQLSVPEQQNSCVEDKKQSRTQHLGEQFSLSKQQDQWVEDEVQLERIKQLDARTEYLSASVSPTHDQLHTTSEIQEAQLGMSSGAYFTQSTLSPCQRTDAKLSIQAPESNADVSYFGYSQQINITEAQNSEHQGMLNTSEENLEHMMAMGNPNEETFVLTLVEIPAYSLVDYGASSASFTPVSEGTLAIVEPVLPLPTENAEVTETASYAPACSSEPPVEAPTASSVSEAVRCTESTQQQWSSDVPRSNLGQMQRKRKAHAFDDEQDPPIKKSPATISINEEATERVQLNEGTAPSKLAIFTSLEECPAAIRSGMINSGTEEMNLQLESTEGFTSTPLESVGNPVPVEAATETHSVSVKEIKKSISQIRRGKLTVKPNIPTKRATCTLDTSKNKNSLKLSKTPKNSPSGNILHAEGACNLSVDMNFSQQKPESAFHNQDQTDGQEHAATTEAGHSSQTLAAVIHAGAMVDADVGMTAEQSESCTQEKASTSSTSLTRPARKPRGFLSFISKKPSESESATKPQRTTFLKPCVTLPRFARKRPIPSEENPEETETSTLPAAKRKSFEKAGGHQPDSQSVPTEVRYSSSLQSWQSESYTEEACCAMEQDTEQMQPTRVAEYFFSDIFTEVEEDEQE